jgi:hypothetical protein
MVGQWLLQPRRGSVSVRRRVRVAVPVRSASREALGMHMRPLVTAYGEWMDKEEEL